MQVLKTKWDKVDLIIIFFIPAFTVQIADPLDTQYIAVEIKNVTALEYIFEGIHLSTSNIEGRSMKNYFNWKT